MSRFLVLGVYIVLRCVKLESPACLFVELEPRPETFDVLGVDSWIIELDEFLLVIHSVMVVKKYKKLNQTAHLVLLCLTLKSY